MAGGIQRWSLILIGKFFIFWLVLAFLAGIFLVNSPAPVRAQTTPQPQAQAASLKDYTRATEDKKFLLVMLSPDGSGQPDPALRQKYKQSGLYPNDGSTTPIWTTDWASWYQNLPGSQLYTTTDGKYLVRLDRSVNLALAFYVIGVEVRRYGLYELVPTLATQSSPAGGPAWVTKASLDSIQHRFVVETATGERLEFDTTTGQRLAGIGNPDSTPLVVAIIAIALFTIPIAVIAYIGVRRQLKFRRLAKKESD